MKQYKGLMYKIRQPDFIVGHVDNPYMHRWWIIPRNKYFNIYLHHFLRSDEDRALHDHPWWNLSLLLKGRYIEHMPKYPKAWVSQGNREVIKKVRYPGMPIFRNAKSVHRIELFKDGSYNPLRVPALGEKATWTLFLTGPVIRDWGFWCPKGWVFWKKFVATYEGGNDVGAGCDQ